MEDYKRPTIIAVDFDGTLCENKWPDIGDPNTELIVDLINFKTKKGYKVILWTNRTGDALDAAVKWCEEQGLIFDAVNDNLPETIKYFGGNGRKIYADLFIDDRALCPDTYKLPYVNCDKLPL